jgi:hypothetical protein
MQKEAKRALGIGQSLGPMLMTVVSKTSARERAGFVKAQATLEAAEAAVRAASNRLTDAQQRKAMTQRAQSDALGAMLGLLAGDGFSRFNPLETFTDVTASGLMRTRAMARAAKVNDLVLLIEQSANTTPATRRAAGALLAATQAVVTAQTEIIGLRVDRHHAVEAREALLAPWRLALSSLRTALRYGDLQEGTAMYERVFGSAQPKGRSRSAPAANPVPAASHA